MKQSTVFLLGALAMLALGAGGLLVWQGRSGRGAPATTPMSMPMGADASHTTEPLKEIEIEIPQESLSRLKLKFAQTSQSSETAQIRAPGTVQPNAYKDIHVTPLIGGVVTQVTAELGQTVKRGQALVHLFSRELAEAQTVFVTNNIELEAEHKKLARAQELVGLGAISREELETVEASHRVHAAHVEEAHQKLLLFGLSEPQIESISSEQKVSSTVSIPSPIDGIITTRSVNLGQVIGMGQELFTVTDLSTVWIEGSLFENDMASVRVGSAAAVTTQAFPGKTFRGTVDYVEPRVDTQTRTAKVRTTLDNPGQILRLGMYVEMLFSSTSAARAVIVPKAAVQAIGSSKVVFIPAKEPGKFLQRTVVTGEEVSDGFIVLDGLSSNERVVTEGSFFLRAESARQHP